MTVLFFLYGFPNHQSFDLTKDKFRINDKFGALDKIECMKILNINNSFLEAYRRK